MLQGPSRVIFSPLASAHADQPKLVQVAQACLGRLEHRLLVLVGLGCDLGGDLRHGDVARAPFEHLELERVSQLQPAPLHEHLDAPRLAERIGHAARDEGGLLLRAARSARRGEGAAAEQPPLQVEQAQVCGRVEEAAHGVEGRLDDGGARQVEGGVEHERHAW